MRKLVILICFSVVAWKLYDHFKSAVAATSQSLPAFQAVTGALVVGDGYVFALADDGELYGWGVNTNKQLGLADVHSAVAPIALPGPRLWRAVHSGDRASIAIDTDGGLWRRTFNTWTYRGGDKSAEQIDFTEIFPAQRWRKAEEGWGLGMGVDEDGGLWMWDDGAFASAPNPDPVADAAVEPVAIESDRRWRDFCINPKHFMAIDSDGRLWQGPSPADVLRIFLRAEETDETASPLTPLGETKRFQRLFCRTSATHTMALDEHYRLWGFGSNRMGELGDGDGDAFTTSKEIKSITPVTDKTWIDIAVSHTYTVGVAGDGTLWAWGVNADGQLGIGNHDYQDRPALVDDRPIWRAVSAGMSMAAALTKDGEIHVWGQRTIRGPSGETISLLGDGDVARVRLKPTPVATTVIWKKGS